ncbi:Hypothetical predicted protein [Olea europaea subsp. europaea]|uniref:Uncharacterized protein n=1 Tax=Olea europaea subsp. europaea TaxID=158383 RepID=A0A8S0TE25_OLEEU|nr:Hypothetical predicted protein [Olea europaea subsp. europaea]
MGIREERFATKGTMNSPEIGEVDDGDVGCAYHLRRSLRKPDQLRESDGVDSRGDGVVDNVDVVEAQVGANDQLVEQIWETSTSDIPCSVENEARVEVANDPVDTQFEQPTFEGAMGLEDPVDTQFEQPMSEGSTGLEDLRNTLVKPSVEEAINAQNTDIGSSGGESEPTDAPQSQKRKRERAAATLKGNAPQSQSQKQKGKKSKAV